MPNVVISGGSRGLGLATARRLAAEGYRVIAVARTESEPLAAAIREAGDAKAGTIQFWPCDLAKIEGIPEFVKSLRAEYGTIEALVNNAAAGTSGVLATMPDAQIARLVALNLVSPLVLTKYVVRSMMTGNGGRIVNITSIAAFSGYSGLSVYGATKASIVGFTRSLARELGPLGITVNAVAPGFIDTEMTRELAPDQRDQIARRSALKRLASPEDVAQSVAFLLGERSRNITGTVLTVDAGNTA
jgi:3-oxoacyl-[acyl-carrier protein] reductase